MSKAESQYEFLVRPFAALAAVGLIVNVISQLVIGNTCPWFGGSAENPEISAVNRHMSCHAAGLTLGDFWSDMLYTVPVILCLLAFALTNRESFLDWIATDD